jgi:predicted dehydrogenase
MNNKGDKRNIVHIGVIGTGWWATEYHIPGVIEHPGARLVAIADNHAGRLEKASAAFGIETVYLNYREMVEKEALDGVVIATPHATHYEIARECLNLNLHILIEKPMTLYAGHARELIELANARSKQIVIGYTYHHFKQAQTAREAIGSGQLGEIEYVNCSFASNMVGFLGGNVSDENSPTRFRVQGPSENYNNPEMMGGGMGHLQMTHPIGYLLYITGLRAKSVQAMMANLNLNVDMVNAFSVEFENGSVGVIGGTGNALSSYRMALAVYCQRGCYIVDTLARFAEIRDESGTLKKLGWQPRSRKPFAVTRNFIDVILGKAQNKAPGEVGWRVVEILDAAYRSAKEQGRPVLIEELYQ